MNAKRRRDEAFAPARKERKISHVVPRFVSAFDENTPPTRQHVPAPKLDSAFVRQLSKPLVRVQPPPLPPPPEPKPQLKRLSLLEAVRPKLPPLQRVRTISTSRLAASFLHPLPPPPQSDPGPKLIRGGLAAHALSLFSAQRTAHLLWQRDSSTSHPPPAFILTIIHLTHPPNLAQCHILPSSPGLLRLHSATKYAHTHTVLFRDATPDALHVGAQVHVWAPWFEVPFQSDSADARPAATSAILCSRFLVR